METAKILEFDTFNRVFYCGYRSKFGIPNTLLIVIDADESNRFFDEMSCESGSTGAAYIGEDVSNKPYAFHYKVIIEKVFAALNNDWTRLADDSWSKVNNPYLPGLEITDTIERIYNLKAFS